MRLNLQLIYDYFEEEKPTLSLSPHGQMKSWFQLVPYQNGLIYHSDFLLFGKNTAFPSSITHRGIICIGKPTEEILINNHVLFFSENTNEKQLFIQLQNLFLKFQQWNTNLHQALRENQPLQHLFILASQIFENSLFMHDNNFYQLASVELKDGAHPWHYNEKQKEYILPIDLLNDFKVNPEYLSTMSTKEPSIFPKEHFGYNILYQNLWYKNQYRGRICINELNRKIRPSDFYLLSYFSDVVMESFKMGEIPTTNRSVMLSRFLIRLIKNEGIDQLTVDKILMQYGWSSRDEYFCVSLFPEERDNKIHSIQYQCNQLAEDFPYVCVFCYEKQIVLIVNTTLGEVTIPLFQNKLAIFLRESLMKAGISTICNDLTQIHYYYKQSICAFETGRKIQATFWCYCFDDYQTEYILKHALSQFPAAMLCSKEIFLLEKYDKTHPSMLAYSLRVYLENDRNLTRTSEILQIHRTSLLYRIERIEALTKLDLDSEKIRFRLLLSYQILDMERGKV